MAMDRALHDATSFAPPISTSRPVEKGRIPVAALGMSLGLFLGVTYILCVLFDLWLPELAMNRTWALLLPGFKWLSWPSFFLGLAETFAYGWYIALVFAPLYNFFAGRYR